MVVVFPFLAPPPHSAVQLIKSSCREATCSDKTEEVTRGQFELLKEDGEEQSSFKTKIGSKMKDIPTNLFDFVMMVSLVLMSCVMIEKFENSTMQVTIEELVPETTYWETSVRLVGEKEIGLM